MKELTFTQLLLGELSAAQWKFQILLLIMGILLRIFQRISNRSNKNKKLSIKFWFKDLRNIAKLLYSIILMYVLIRFFGDYEEYLKSFMPEKMKASMYLIMIILGFFLHRISAFIDAKFSNEKQ